MIDRRAFIGTLTGGLLAAPLAAGAQQASRIPRIGVLRSGPPSDAGYQGFALGLKELGYVEGKNVVIEYRGGELTQLPVLATELVGLKVDVIFAPTPPAAMAARQATATIPIVFAVVGDPVRTGLVASLARPDGNVTGLTALGSDLGGKRLDLLKELSASLRRVAVLWNPSVPDKVIEWEQMQAPAHALGLQLESIEARTPGDVDGALKSVARARPEGVIILGEPLMYANRTRVAEFANANRIPAIFNWREAATAGGLISYGPNIADNNRRAATYVDKILKGAKPADLPVEQPTKFELVINLKTAKALGLTIPPSLLLRADEVIE